MAESLYRQLARLLRDGGCRFVRQGKGSHEIWFSPIRRRHFAVPSNIGNAHTANAILKQAGLPKAFCGVGRALAPPMAVQALALL